MTTYAYQTGIGTSYFSLATLPTAWSNTTDYTVGQPVSYSSRVYVALVNNSGVAPASGSTTWGLAVVVSYTAPSNAPVNGTYPIPSGANFVVVTFSLPFDPVGGKADVLKQTGGLTMAASIRQDTLTRLGFTADLTGTTDSSNYVLSYTVY